MKMKDDVKKDQQNGRDVKSRDKKSYSNRSPSRRDRSRSPVDRRNKDLNKASRRVYVANISFDTRWTEVKDFFRDKIGNVNYCQMFEDEEGRSRGCGLIEFTDTATAKRAIDELHRYNFKGRELVVKEDIDCDRDRFGRLITNSKKEKDRDQRETNRSSERQSRQIYDPMRQTYSNSYNTFGLSPQFLESLNISGPLNNRIFVANLDYKVGEKKLEEIFRLAGKVLRVRLYTDQTGTSKGHGTVEFEHPVESVQAISMFRDQNLYGRPMSIRMDKYETEEMPEVLPSKLPSGLESIGKGLGEGGQPLNISKMNATMATGQQSVSTVQNNTTASLQSVVPTPVAQPQTVNSYSVSGLSNVLGQQNLGQNLVGLNPNTLSTSQVNQALNNGLNSLGLGNLNASSLTASLANNQNLTQLANTAQNVLAGLPLGNNSSLNPSIGLASANQAVTQNNLFSSYERDYSNDKYRNGVYSQTTNVPSVQSAATDKVIIRNLPINYTWQNLRDRFGEIGEVRYADTMKNRGMAVVQYANSQDAARAVSLMNGLRIENKVIDVGFYY